MEINFKTLDTPDGWEPAQTVDLGTVSATAFQDFTYRFKQWAEQQTRAADFTTGWWMITPYLCEELLKRAINGNRKVALQTVKEYARQMAEGDWTPTGETGIIDEHGNVRDIQHRAWAGYLSQSSFPVFLVTGVPDVTHLSARIDSGLNPRSPAEALYMAGLNGVSAPVAAAVAIANRYDHRGFGVLKNKYVNRLVNAEVVDYCLENPDIRDAARTVLSDHAGAVKVIGNKGIAVFVAWKIIELYGSDVLDGFMLPFASGANMDEDDPVLALRNRFLADDGDINVARRLGLVIKAFNMHHQGQTIRLGRGRGTGLNLGDNEAFPRFVEPGSEAAAAQ